MNRVHSIVNPPRPQIEEAAFQVESGLFSTPTAETALTLFVPLHYEPGYAYPLIVWLHGRGGDERQLTRVMPMMSMRNFLAIAPRGVCAAETGRGVQRGYTWEQSEKAVGRAEQGIFDAIETASRKLHVHRDRVYLAGFDCGGTMAFRVAMNHPGRFAGVLSLCGAFPRGCTPLGNLVEARRLQVMLTIGRDSREYPAAEVCENLRLFHTAGLSVMLRQYPSGHELSPQMLTDMNRWIIEQITPSDPTA